MAGVASDDQQIQLQQPNPTFDQRLAMHPPTFMHNAGNICMHESEDSAPLSSPSSERRFVPAFIDFIAVGALGVGIHQVIHNEYASGIPLIFIACTLFLTAFFWNKLAPSEISRTALNVAHDFRWWVAITLLFIAYFATYPYFGVRDSSHLITWDEGAYIGKPLAIQWISARLLTSMPQPNVPEIISNFIVGAMNAGLEEITLKDGFLISEVDGTKVKITVSSSQGQPLQLDETAPVPPGAYFDFVSSFGNQMTEQEFLRRWQTFALVIQYDNNKVRRDFSRQWVLEQISNFHPEARPHVSRRQP